jgi:adenosylmethionine-8-amino-7-oxononanoate aminotransferase
VDEREIQRLVALDHAHVWHPFTPMRQWREAEPVIIEAGAGDELIDVHGRRYIDGVSSLWCNVHGHRVASIDDAIRGQLERIAHTTMLGLANVPATELAARLVSLAPGPRKLNKVFYSDSGATATEVAFKMAVGYWFHRGEPERNTFIALSGAYHGDTVGAMSVGYSELFHRPYKSMVFHTEFVSPPQVAVGYRRAENWALEDEPWCNSVRDRAIGELDDALTRLGGQVAGVVVEPLVQGAAGMLMQPPGYLRGVADLVKKHGTLLIADEVATGFGRTGRMFACEHEEVTPDILCLGKGLSGGYLPLAATLATEAIEQAFTGELHEHKTLYHGHTFTGNPLACAAALASLDLFDENNVLAEVNRKAELLRQMLTPLRELPEVSDVRQRGLMVGIELGGSSSDGASQMGDFGETTNRYARRIGHEVCAACRAHGVIVRPLGNVVVLMPPLAIQEKNLRRLAEVVVGEIAKLK